MTTNKETGPAANSYKGDPDYMQSLARGLQVITAFSDRRRPLRAAEIALKTGLARAVVQRCLYTLQALGYAEQEGAFWKLRPAILQLGHAYFSSTSIVSLAQPILDDLSDRVGETCALALLDGDEILYLARAQRQRVLTVSLGLGSRLPAHCTSIGRMMLSQLPQSRLDAYLELAPFKIMTQYTAHTREALLRELKQVQEKDYSLIKEELELGLTAIGVPVRSASGRVVAGMSISIKDWQDTEEKLIQRCLPELRSSARQLGLMLPA
ncbi:MAG: IclR family transcriptional regulator domain-containing protein [Alcaligenes faecalis]